MMEPSGLTASRPRSVARLHQTFSKSLTAADLVEPLASLDGNQQAGLARELMKDDGRAVLGVRQRGLVTGWVDEEDLASASGSLQEAARPFQEESAVDADAGLGTVLTAMSHAPRVFVRWLGEVGGVICHQDLQKAPLRMWLFGTVTLLDLNMTWAIEELHPAEAWGDKISAGRLGKAQALQTERRRCGGDCRLVDCLQIKDKADILLHEPQLIEDLGFVSRREADRFARAIESLRNHLAHSQELEQEHVGTAARLATFMDSIIHARGVRRMVGRQGAG
ncbi:hypothetical protein [Verrucomicrobium sp. BvORR106]|uniref:hypothetical protein n=1 Tax=Verrucomicrobium sp. BvORR106 TaxID=1403819 RepID=UPI0006925498|nr:hypothetical protein [Verrucomicrobium sp. BvORR106]